jgi:DNA-binding NarL/FixJ family response regulator
MYFDNDRGTSTGLILEAGMEKPLTILLVEDEPAECQQMIEYIESKSDVQLVGVTNNIDKAMEHALDAEPDAIILDLELHKGCGDGLTFLEELRAKSTGYPAYVLITTNNISTVTHNSARKLGADFIMVKSQEDYSAKRVIEFLYSLKGILHSSKKTATAPGGSDTPEQRQRRINRRIMAELDLIGIPPNVLGRRYLIDRITLLVDGKSAGFSAAVSEKYAKSVASVERAMQNAIEKAWKTAHIDDLVRHYTARIHSAKGVPTMSEFIYHYAEKIRNER